MLENIASVNLTELIEKKSTPAQLRVIQEVAKVINEGLLLQDALLLCRVTKVVWDKWVEEIPEIDSFIQVQRLEYKRALLKVLYNQAIEGHDFKIASTLLMSAFPSEYNPAVQKENEKRKPLESEENSMVELFSLIQKSPIALIYKEEQKKESYDIDRVTKSLEDILS